MGGSGRRDRGLDGPPGVVPAVDDERGAGPEQLSAGPGGGAARRDRLGVAARRAGVVPAAGARRLRVGGVGRWPPTVGEYAQRTRRGAVRAGSAPDDAISLGGGGGRPPCL